MCFATNLRIHKTGSRTLIICFFSFPGNNEPQIKDDIVMMTKQELLRMEDAVEAGGD